MRTTFWAKKFPRDRGLRTAALCGALSLLTLAGFALAVGPARAETLYSVNRTTDELVMIDSGTGVVTPIHHFDQDMDEVDLAISADRRTLYALNSHFGQSIQIFTIKLDNFQVTQVTFQPVTLDGITPNSDIKPGYSEPEWNCGGTPSAEGLAIVGDQLVIGFQMWNLRSPSNCNSLSNYIAHLNPVNGIIEPLNPEPFDLISLSDPTSPDCLDCPFGSLCTPDLRCRADIDGMTARPDGRLLVVDGINDGRWNDPSRTQFVNVLWPNANPTSTEIVPGGGISFFPSNDVALSCTPGRFYSIYSSGAVLHNIADGSIISTVPLSPPGEYFGLALVPCEQNMLGNDKVCVASTGNTYSVEGQPAGTLYSWTITGNGSIVGPTDGSSVTVNAGSAGSFTLTASMDAGSRLAEKVVTVENCLGNCPRTAGFWTQQYAQKGNGSTKFTVAEVSQIAECVDDHSALFGWAPGTDFSSFGGTVDPPSPMNQRKQAKRQFATMLANVCTGQLGLTANNGDKISLSLDTPINCAGLTSGTIGGVIGEVDGRLVSLEGQPLSDPLVKSQYSNLIACLDAINNGIGIGTVCPEAAPVPGGGIGLARGVVGRVFAALPAPNPFSQSTYFVLAVPGAESKPVDVRVFDVSGKLVRILATGTLTPGRHEMVWDGYSEQARRMPTGVYFLQSAVGEDRAVIRLLYLR